MTFTEKLESIYGGKNNRSWNQNLYLQEKAREASEARKKQVSYAEEYVRELKKIAMEKKSELKGEVK
jgi:hypothetical protein